jgi:hypothetical protein
MTPTPPFVLAPDLGAEALLTGLGMPETGIDTVVQLALAAPYPIRPLRRDDPSGPARGRGRRQPLAARS